MNKHFLAVSLIVVLTASHVQAQFNFGVRTGLNYTKVLGTGVAPVNNLKAGFQFGVVADYAVNGKFSIEPGLLFSTLGYKGQQYVTEYPTGKKAYFFKYQESPNYIQIPVHARYKLGNKVFLHAGPYFGFAIGGKASAEYLDNDGNRMAKASHKLTFRLDDSHSRYSRTFDYGLGVGVAVKFGNVQVGLEGNTGLAGISKYDTISFEDIFIYKKNGGFALTATYMFGK